MLSAAWEHAIDEWSPQASTGSGGWKRAASVAQLAPAVNAIAILAPAGKPDAEPSQSEHQQQPSLPEAEPDEAGLNLAKQKAPASGGRA
jgi:hypothetical protein|eukprot:COSAG02_NODE_1346_length_13140_cov_106.669964_6_plen_89_part_00